MYLLDLHDIVNRFLVKVKIAELFLFAVAIKSCFLISFANSTFES